MNRGNEISLLNALGRKPIDWKSSPVPISSDTVKIKTETGEVTSIRGRVYYFMEGSLFSDHECTKLMLECEGDASFRNLKKAGVRLGIIRYNA